MCNSFLEVNMQKPKKMNQFRKSLISRPLLAGAAAAGALALAGGAAQGAIFAKITTPTITGDATAPGHEGEIELFSFQEGWGRTSKYGNSGVVLGRAACSGVTVTKSVDRSSLPLVDTIIKGNSLGKVVISITRESASGTPVNFYTITLHNAVVDGISQSSGGDRPSESLSFVPLTIDLSYQPGAGDAKTSPPITSSIDCRQ